MNIVNTLNNSTRKEAGQCRYIGAEEEVSIRLASLQDAGLLTGWWNDGRVMEHAGFPNGLGTGEKEVEALIKGEDEYNHRLIIEISNRPSGEMNYRIEDRTAEIGIKICDTSCQEKGFGTKALKLLINHLFSEKDVDKIILDTNLKNTRAQHVYEKLGFRKVRVNIDAWKNQMGELQSSVDYELRKEDHII